MISSITCHKNTVPQNLLFYKYYYFIQKKYWIRKLVHDVTCRNSTKDPGGLERDWSFCNLQGRIERNIYSYLVRETRTEWLYLVFLDETSTVWNHCICKLSYLDCPVAGAAKLAGLIFHIQFFWVLLFTSVLNAKKLVRKIDKADPIMECDSLSFSRKTYF